MSDDLPTIDDIMPDPEASQWVAIIECQVCGEQGTMYSTHEPREKQYWDCEVCGNTDARHEVIVASNTSQPIE